MLHAYDIYVYSYLDVGQTIGLPKPVENAPRCGLHRNLQHTPATKMPLHLPGGTFLVTKPLCAKQTKKLFWRALLSS